MPPGTVLDIETTTVFGTTAGRIISAGNGIFTGLVTAERRQTGCVRFCYVPDGSQTAPPIPLPARSRTHRRDRSNRTETRFVPDCGHSLRLSIFGQPGYAQLSQRCAVEIATGAEDGSEMGVFSFLQQPQTQSELRTALDEYLRFGLEAGMIEQT